MILYFKKDAFYLKFLYKLVLTSSVLRKAFLLSSLFFSSIKVSESLILKIKISCLSEAISKFRKSTNEHLEYFSVDQLKVRKLSNRFTLARIMILIKFSFSLNKGAKNSVLWSNENPSLLELDQLEAWKQFHDPFSLTPEVADGHSDKNIMNVKYTCIE